MSGQRTRNVMLTFYVTENEKEVIKQRMALDIENSIKAKQSHGYEQWANV